MNLHLWPSNLVPGHLHSLYWPSRHQLSSSNQYSASILRFDLKFMQKLSWGLSWVTLNSLVTMGPRKHSLFEVSARMESRGEIWSEKWDLDLWLWNLRVIAHFTHKDCWCMKYEPDWTRREKICFILGKWC